MFGRVRLEADEYWMSLAWFTRLRWVIAPSLYVVAKLAEWASYGRFEAREGFILLVLACACNAGYERLLLRWRGSSQVRRLQIFAHAQIAIDIAFVAGAVYCTGGGNSPFWPFFCAPVMGGALFFASLPLLGFYMTYALGALLMVAHLSDTPLHPANAVMLVLLLSTLIVIVHYYSSRLSEAHLAAIHLERLRLEKASADQLSRRKDHILSLVSHELGNPVAALRGFIYAAQMTKRPASEIAQLFSRMEHQVERLTRVIRDLYDVAAIQNGTLAVDPRPCDLALIARELAVRFRTVRPELELVIDAEPELTGNWDPVRIDQMLTNLVENAAKYAGESGPVLLGARREGGDWIQLEVHDPGPGIEPDRLELIFEPFARFDAGRSRSGLGLGLPIAREIAVLHGGTIQAESVPGQGSTFRIRLPISAPARARL